jgi:transposase
MNVTTVGIDLAKRVFFVHAEDDNGHVVLRKKLSRQALPREIARLPHCTIAMEACGGAHFWARRFGALGHHVRLINPKFVKPFVKTNKNDWNDAAAICEAAQRPTMRFVAVKTVEQQDVLALHRVRERLVAQRTSLVNQIRGLLQEYGVVLGVQITRLRRELPEVLEDATNELSSRARVLFAALYAEIQEIDARIEPIQAAIESIARQSEACQRLQTIPGVGPLSATALMATAGDPRLFKNGRHFAAFLGLVPHQLSSGGRTQLVGISRRGDKYMRKLLILGGHATLRHLKGKKDRRSQWARQVASRRGKCVATIAIANKNARIAWSLLRHGSQYQTAA